MKKIATTISNLFFVSLLFAQQAPNFWQQVSDSEVRLAEKSEYLMLPSKHITFELDFDAIRNYLRTAPPEGSAGAKSGAVQLQLPMPDGKMEVFKIWDSPVMHPDLAARYPMIRTFAGRGLTDPTHVVRFGYGEDGFHAFIPSENGGSVTERFATEQTKYYMCYAYYPSDFGSNGLPKLNLVEEDQLDETMDLTNVTNDGAVVFRGGGDGALAERRDYLFVLACTGEYGQSHGGTTSSVLSTLVTATSTMNMLLERDIDVRFILHPQNDQVVYLDPGTDPYQNSNLGGALLGQNQSLLDQVIGIGNYDVGHVYTGACSDVGGVVSGTVCATGKARGVTCNFSSNVVATTLSIAAHEIMHQFSGGHTFNHCPGNEGQFSSSSAREPGSGSTILSYQGACGASNIPGPANVMYNAGSISEVYSYTRDQGGNFCSTVAVSTNHSPTVTENYSDGFYIPVLTPFELEVSAEDADGDPLTYSWEQWNRTPSAPLGSPFGDAPTFRVYDPVTSPKRVFPKLPTILSNTNEIVEILPAYSRNLEFRCVVRDNNTDEGAGGVTWASVSFEATELAGPFRVTYPNSGLEVWKAGEEVEITWDVANTDNDLVKCRSVNIWISTDGGLSFSHLLASATPNDGSEVVTVPDLVSSNVRVRIEAAQNIFFDLSNENFKIVEADAPAYSVGLSPQWQQACVPSVSMVDVNIGSIQGFDSPVALEILGGLPQGALASLSSDQAMPGQPVTVSFDMNDVTLGGLYEVELRAIAGTDTTYKSIFLQVVFNDFSALTLDGPVNGSSDNGLSQMFTWTDLPNADLYDFQLSTSPVFEAGTILDEAYDLTGNSYQVDFALEESTTYYWRVRPSNICGHADFSLKSTFQTFSSTCSPIVSEDVPKNISAIGLPVVESQITVLESGIISDVNIKDLKGTHDALPDLQVKLISPAGTEALLFREICGNVSTFDLDLDDESPFEIQCPPLNSLSYQPQTPLSVFDGENTLGNWTLEVAVINTDGTGGVLQGWTLEFCASVDAQHPFLLHNDTIYVRPEQTAIIHNYELFAGDPDNTANDLKVNIIDNTKYGYVARNGVPLEVGDFFRFTEVNAGIITYTNTHPEEVYDFFTFTITDGQGGLLGTPRFNIVIDENAVTGTDEAALANKMLLFPNPASSLLNVNFQLPLTSGASVFVTDVRGQLVATQSVAQASQKTQLDLSSYANGIYFISVRSADEVLTKKFVVQR
ncbi:MAG TPA: T9SS type A sorting domain-containing protein [Bacteroidetes bacterium]|nr:T9SS type A sorting domain-containing protein [Bacteroidota bacterium]